MRLSTFMSWLIYFFILAAIIIASLYIPDVFSKRIIIVIFGMSAFITSFFFFDEISDTFSLKYKIIEKEGFLGTTKYYAHVLKFWWIIPMWEPVKTTTESYKVQNMFGAKFSEYYDSEVTFNSQREAIAAINEHKNKVKDARKSFFKRPEKKIEKVTYL